MPPMSVGLSTIIIFEVILLSSLTCGEQTHDHLCESNFVNDLAHIQANVNCRISNSDNGNADINISWLFTAEQTASAIFETLMSHYFRSFYTFCNCLFLSNFITEASGDYDNTSVIQQSLRFSNISIPCYDNCSCYVHRNAHCLISSPWFDSGTCYSGPRGPRSAVYNVTVNRAEDSDVDIGIKFKITFDLPPFYETCSSEDVSHVFIKWKGSNHTNHLLSYNTSVLDGRHGTVSLRIDDEERWKTVDFAVSFNFSVGLSKWSEWYNVSSATNRDIRKDDIKFEITDVGTSSITVGWLLSARAKSMKHANFIINFHYIINDDLIFASSEENYNFSNLSSATNYHIVGKVITSDSVANSLNNLEFTANGKTLDEPPTDPVTNVPVTSSEGLNDTMIIAITVCTAVVVLILLITLLFPWKSGIFKRSNLNLKIHELQIEQIPELPTAIQPTYSGRDFFTFDSPSLGGQCAAHSKESVRSGSGQDNERFYSTESLDMLTAITRKRHADNTAYVSSPSIPSNSHSCHNSSANFGEGYVSPDNAIALLGDIDMTVDNQSTYSQIKIDHSANQAATSEIVTLSDETISTIKDGQYVSPNTLDNIVQAENATLDSPCTTSPKGTSSIDSDYIGSYHFSTTDI